VRSFWSFYAGRYAARTHVLYEVHNIPEFVCDAPWQPKTLSMQLEAHDLIREAAPESHIFLLSYADTPSKSALSSSLDALEGVVDWSKASVGFHTRANCVPLAEIGGVLEVARQRRIAAHCSEIPADALAQETLVLEQNQLGWFSFRWLVESRDLEAFKQQHNAAGTSWCPDFGDWPLAAGLCRAP